jgi:aminoglycoside 3'-phosphotransferase II
MNFDVAGLPTELQRQLSSCRAERVHIGESGNAVFRLWRSGEPPLFLKIGVDAGGTDIRAEAERLRWLATRAPVPRLIGLLEDHNRAFMLLEALPGRNGVDAARDQPREVVVGLAKALDSLHAQPIGGCPFDQRIDAQIARAEERTRLGLVDESDFDQERQGRHATELLPELRHAPPDEGDLVLTHGDACLPNVIFEHGKFVGFVDVGRAGVAGRYQDLALAARSIAYNLGPACVQPFFDAYGVTSPDERLLHYYRLLDEFF